MHIKERPINQEVLEHLIENEISQWLIITATIPIFDTFTKRLEIAFQQVRLLNIFICAEKPEAKKDFQALKAGPAGFFP